MHDGAQLGLALAASGGDVEAALLAYEEELFPRSASAATEAEMLLELLLGDDTPRGLIDFFTRNRSGE